MAMRYNRNVNINRVVKRLVRSVIALYVGGTVMAQLGTVMNCTSSGFYGGLSLIGWTVTNNLVPTSTGLCNATSATIPSVTGTYQNVITGVSGTGILVVVGIIAIAQIITEFITW